MIDGFQTQTLCTSICVRLSGNKSYILIGMWRYGFPV